MDTVEIERSDGATTVPMDRRLRRLPVFAASEDHAVGSWSHPARAVESVFRVHAERSSRPLVTVRGPVDVGTVEELRHQVQDVSRGGSLPLDLDLARVSHLASAGIQTLHELAEQMAVDGRALGVIAPPGCPARYVLELTGLDRLVLVAPSSAPLPTSAPGAGS